jgi:type VI secretion system protein VasI
MSEIGDKDAMNVTQCASYCWFAFTLCLVATPAAVADTSETGRLVEQANQCRELTERLERLSCFDRVFETPMQAAVGHAVFNTSPSWQRASAAAKRLSADQTMVLTEEGDGELGNAWITLQATNEESRFTQQGKPLLLLSCIDNLSRVELALPSEIPDARVKISLASGTTRYWRSDDSGMLLSSGRGMPAIEVMKDMTRDSRAWLRSNSKSVDGLMFDTSHLSELLPALKRRCGW